MHRDRDYAQTFSSAADGCLSQMQRLQTLK